MIALFTTIGLTTVAAVRVFHISRCVVLLIVALTGAILIA
jgi:hypothetical protein